MSTCTQRADMHGSSEAVALAARTPAQATPPPRGHRGSRREDQQADRPAQRVPRNPAPSRRGDRGPAEDPGPHSRPPGPIPPSLCGPDGEHAPLAEITLWRRTTEFDRLSQRPRPNQRGCDSRRPPGLPGEKEGLASPTSARGRGPGDLSVEGRPCRRDAPQPPPRAPVTRQSSDVLPPDARPATDRSGRRGRGTGRPGPRLNCPKTVRPGPRGTT